MGTILDYNLLVDIVVNQASELIVGSEQHSFCTITSGYQTDYDGLWPSVEYANALLLLSRILQLQFCSSDLQLKACFKYIYFQIR